MPFRGYQSVKSYDDLMNALIPTTIVTSPATTEFGFYRGEDNVLSTDPKEISTR